MKWSLELGIAVGLTVVVWAAFYFAFPGAPFSVAETAFVLVVFYGLVKLARWTWSRWSAKPGAARK